MGYSKAKPCTVYIRGKEFKMKSVFKVNFSVSLSNRCFWSAISTLSIIQGLLMGHAWKKFIVG
jgi:hypothetical protein